MTRTRRLWRWFLVLLSVMIALSVPTLSTLGGHGTTAQAATCWQGAITQQWTDLSLAGSVLRVSVEGQVGLPVKITSEAGYTAYGFTGTKPEYGPYVAEFAPVHMAAWTIEPQGLGIVFSLWLDGKSYTRVDFTPTGCAPTATPHPPTPTATRTPAKPVSSPKPPNPTATPPAQWQGRVAQHSKNPGGGVSVATVAVRVIGRPAGQQVVIQSGSWSASALTGTKPQYGGDACEFGGLSPATYRLIPTGLGTYLDITVGAGDFALIEFYPVGSPPPAHWVGAVQQNTSGSEPTDFSNSAIAVIVAGRPYHDVEIRSGNWSAVGLTGTKPEYGPDACEFGGLSAGVYTITPSSLGASVSVTMDGRGWALIRFDEVPGP
jgi:hypothetical protein